MRDVTSKTFADAQLGLVEAEVRRAERWIAAPNVPRTELERRGQTVQQNVDSAFFTPKSVAMFLSNEFVPSAAASA